VLQNLGYKNGADYITGYVTELYAPQNVHVTKSYKLAENSNKYKMMKEVITKEKIFLYILKSEGEKRGKRTCLQTMDYFDVFLTLPNTW
jgi:hypothetical protein